MFEKFADYKPREGTPSFTAGPKIANVDTMIWSTIGDDSTAVSALLSGEVDASATVVKLKAPLRWPRFDNARRRGGRAPRTEPWTRRVRRCCAQLPSG